MDNAATLFVDAPVEEGHGDRTALVTPAASVTYAALQRLSDRAAHALLALGVEPEQRVALLMADGPGWAATFFGALKLGAVAVPLNTRLGPADLRAVLADCRPRVLVADRPLLEAAAIDPAARSEEHTSELQSQSNLVCRLLLEKKKKKTTINLSNKKKKKKKTQK